MRDIIALTRNYRYKYASSNASLAERLGDLIMNSLHYQHTQNDTEGCFEAVSLAYAVASVAMFEPFNDFSGPIRWPRDLVANNAAYTFIATFLATTGKVKVIDPAWRNKQSCLWKARASDKKSYHVSGAFNCASKTIFLDPFLRPINMGAVFLHEIDHLFRDSAYDLSRFAGDLNEFLLIDETLALARAAYLQVHRREHNAGNGMFAVELKDDISLYKRGGAFETIYKVLQKDGPVTMHRFFTQSLLPSYQNGLNRKLFSQIFDVYKTVHSAYFPGQTLQSGFMSTLAIYSHQNMTPLNFWGNRLSGFVSSVPADFPSFTEDGPDWTNGYVRNGHADSDSILRAISWLSRRLSTKSKTCEIFLKDLKESVYLGNPKSKESCPAERIGETGVRPEDKTRLGETGVRPGETGVRPGETGVRPETKPLKWGESGVRPGETGVRPCIHIEDQL